MKSTFWMTAQETEDEIKRREDLRERIRVRHATGNVKYPFSDKLEFCPQHGINSDVIAVDQCPNCRITL